MTFLKTGRPSKKDKAIASVQDSELETVRMNVNISKPFYRQIKQKALDHDMTVKEIVLKALNEYMSK